MPKKTRKQKVAAQLRRLKTANTENKTTLENEERTPDQSTYVFEPKNKTPNNPPKTENGYLYLPKELKQLYLLIVLSLVFQIGLSLTLGTDSANLLLRSLGIEF